MIESRDEAADELLDIGSGDDILVADDSRANLLAIEAALAPLGRALVLVDSGLDALARLLEQDFALILLDVAMPGMSGIETARLVRSRPRSRGTPILFVTGLAWDDDAIDEAYAVGGVDFLVKPFRSELLRAKARVFLQLQERTRALQRNERALRESQARLHAHELAEQRAQFESQLLARELERLAAADRQRDELVAMLGHELRDPLRALRVVDSLLDLARSAAGQLELRREPVELDQLARCAIEECRPLLDQRHHAVELIVEGGAAPTVLGDPPRLVQVLAKLIDNAARYTPTGGRISVAVRAEGSDAVATVTDNGRGIPSEQLPRIFDLFVRHHAATDLAGGIGLGLGLVKRLISLHDGAVCASSRGAGQGSAFEIRIPLAPQELELSGLYVDQGHPTVRMPALERPQREPEPALERSPALADAERR